MTPLGLRVVEANLGLSKRVEKPLGCNKFKAKHGFAEQRDGVGFS
ncbi:hypothetical protein ACJU1S_001497 [Campylobacter upsaliensis]